MSDIRQHLKSTGNINAIRDWLNASLYNKEEIQNLFIDHNGSGLKAYDLTITGEPEQMIKMVGQTSGRVYNVCLAAILGDIMSDVFNINDYETPGKLLNDLNIYGWAVPFEIEGSIDYDHWANISGTVWSYDQIDGNVIDTLLASFVINKDQSGIYTSAISNCSWDKQNGCFNMSFVPGYNSWLVLIYTKP